MTPTLMLVSLEQAKEHLRIDSTAGDNDLRLKIKAASLAVLRYIDAEQDFIDTDDGLVEDTDGVAADIPEDIQLATLALVGDFYNQREGQSEASWEHGFLPLVVRTLLFPFRTPTSA